MEKVDVPAAARAC